MTSIFFQQSLMLRLLLACMLVLPPLMRGRCGGCCAIQASPDSTHQSCCANESACGLGKTEGATPCCCNTALPTADESTQGDANNSCDGMQCELAGYCKCCGKIPAGLFARHGFKQDTFSLSFTSDCSVVPFSTSNDSIQFSDRAILPLGHNERQARLSVWNK